MESLTDPPCATRTLSPAGHGLNAVQGTAKDHWRQSLMNAMAVVALGAAIKPFQTTVIAYEFW